MSLESDPFSQFEYRGWQRVANKYESTWSGLTRLFIPELLEAVGVLPGMRLLDVACGPGYVAEAARSLGAKPIGVDFAPEMIRLARARNPEIEFRLGDALALDFEDRSFDAVVMNFGLLHLSNPEAAFSEARRLLRPGGRYGFTVWAGPEQSPGAGIVDEAVRAHADSSVALPPGPDYFGFGNENDCRETLSRLDFDSSSLVFRTVTAEWRVPTASFVFEAERDAGVRTAAVLAAQNPDTLSRIQSHIETALRPYAREIGFSIPYAAHVVAVSAA